MQFDDLRRLCLAAAQDIVSNHDPVGGPLTPTVVLPGGDKTQLLALSGFPDEDEARHAYLATFAQDQLADRRVPAWGLVVQAEVNGVDAVVVVYGARKKAPELTAAPLTADGVGQFVDPEPLDPTAMPFLHPLQHAVDSLPAEPADRGQGRDQPNGGLPLF